MDGTAVTVAAAYPQSTLNGTPTCCSLSGTASYKTYVASRRNLDVYHYQLHTHTQTHTDSDLSLIADSGPDTDRTMQPAQIA